MKYKLDGQLFPVNPADTISSDDIIVEIIDSKELEKRYKGLNLHTTLAKSIEEVQYCKADVLSDCVVGTFLIPDKNTPQTRELAFGFYMTTNKLVFIDESSVVKNVLTHIHEIQMFEKTAIAHLFYEFMEHFIKNDVIALQNHERKLEELEERLLKEEVPDFNEQLLSMRKDLLILWSYYNQLMDLSEDLKENMNGMFTESDSRLFDLFYTRVERLMDHTAMLRELTVHLRELHQSQTNMRMNKIMQFLTVITAVFMPLTLIAGWYGMNFINMPELKFQDSYFIVAAISAVVIVAEVIYFKKKKWW